ncbi:unnamed protein product [Schistosoma curassoni]|uniref:Cadherin domain-containing protein n=1 Tax=Schistosoma curassoni TaxID=6186 RepID=A0A183KH20_9TREM|nr:unnamed protein product [Schistosoma curassoni]
MFSTTVRASDGEFYAFTQLLIKIIDVNDELPEFLLNPLQLIINENQPAKTLIGHLLIIDRDSPKVNGQVHCEEPSHLIRNQPILFVQESLYLNEQTLLQKEFHHHHHHNNYSTIFSTLSSSSSSLSYSNTETHVYQRFTLYSQNKYDRENLTDKYLAILYCWDGIPNSFSNSPLSAEYDNKHVSMNSISTSNSLTATMTIVLHILDENDNEPIFDKQLYKATLKENSPINTKIIQVSNCLMLILYYLVIHLLTYFHTYLLTYFNTNLLTYLLPHLLTYLLQHLLTYLLTYFNTDLFTYLFTYLLTYLFTYLLPHLLTYFHTYLLTYFHTYLLTYLLQHLLTYLLPHLLTYLLQH